MNLSQVIIKPVLTEKSAHQEVASKYTFMVHEDATKVDVRNAIVALYGVTVAKVNVLSGLPKYRIGRGRKPMQKRAANRKAIITLKKGEKLELTKVKPVKANRAKRSEAPSK